MSDSAPPKPAADLSEESEGVPSPPRRTLDEELKGGDFATRGWLRLTDLTDYLAHLVDGRSSGYLKSDPSTHAIILRLATVLKAGTQWFADEPSDREAPRFIVEAEKYLAEGPVGVPIVRKGAEELSSILRSGAVTSRRGARGGAGRIQAMKELKIRLIASVVHLSQGELNDRQAEYRRRLRAGVSCDGTVAHTIAHELLIELAQGTFAETLLTQGFTWNFEEQLDLTTKAIGQALDEADVGAVSAPERESQLEKLSEILIRTGMHALGLSIEKDLFRHRHG